MTSDPTLDRSGPRPVVRVARRYPHPIAAVWEAVSTEQLGEWFPSPVEIDLRPGGRLRFPGFEGFRDGAAAAGTVEVVEPPTRLVFTWGHDRLTFQLVEEAPSVTTFVLVHEFDAVPDAASFATGWETCMGALDRVLDGEPVPPPTRGVARHEELVRRFGLDRPDVDRDGDTWTVRIERQLTCPADVAGQLWAGARPDGAAPGDGDDIAFTDGTGHGARAVLTVSGSAAGESDAATTWVRGASDRLAAAAADWASRSDVAPDS